MQDSTRASSSKTKDKAKDGSCYAQVLPVEKSYQDKGFPEEHLPLPTSVDLYSDFLYHNPLGYVIIKSM